MTTPTDTTPAKPDRTEHMRPESGGEGIYVVRLRHDSGTITITIGLASTPRKAVDMVLAAEHAPRSAVVWVKARLCCDYCTSLATRYVRDSDDDTPLCDGCARDHYGSALAARAAT